MVLTANQSLYLQHCYSFLQQQHAFTVVKLRPTNEALDRMQKVASDSNYCNNINLTEKYASEFPSDEREFLQSFRDRCIELSRTRHMQALSGVDMGMGEAGNTVRVEQIFFLIEDASWPCQSATPSNAQLLDGYWEHPMPYILGHVVQYIDGQGMRCLDICNHATVLLPDNFAMGGGDKQDKAHAAGHFGEGMKVQINRLMAERNLSVGFVTGACVLKFTQECAPHCQKPTLHMRSSQAQQHGHPSRDSGRLEETICSIYGPQTAYPSLNTDQYLFLQPLRSTQGVPLDHQDVPAWVKESKPMQSLRLWYPSIHTHDAAAKMEIQFLFEPEYVGKVYIHGILLNRRLPTYKPDQLSVMGVCFSGSTKVMKEVAQLNRDRGQLNVSALLAHYTPSMLGCLLQQSNSGNDNSRMDCLLAHVYAEVMKEDTVFKYLGESEIYHYSSKQRWQGVQYLAEKLNKMLARYHGFSDNTDVHPCDAKTYPVQAGELKLLGFQPLQVSSLFLTMLHNTKQLRSIEQLWQSRRVEVDKLADDLDSWPPEERKTAEEILMSIADLFFNVGPRICISPHTMEGWRKSMKVLGMQSETLSHENVIIPFKQDPNSGRGPLLLIEARYLKSLEEVHRRLRQTGDSCPGGDAGGGCNCIPELLLQEASAALQKLDVPQQVLNKCVMAEAIRQKLAGSNLQNIGRSAATTRPAQSPSPGSEQSRSPNVRVVPSPRVGDGICSNYARPGDIMSSVAGSLVHNGAAPTMVPGNRPNEDRVVEVDDDPADRDLHRTHIVVGGSETNRAFLYLPEGMVLTDQMVAHISIKARQMYAGLAILLQNVFYASSPSSSGGPQFFLFYDPDRTTIAFNRRAPGEPLGQLWFNAAVQVDTSGTEGSPDHSWLRFWYLVCCHELAHNQVEQHNSKFSDACSAITLHYALNFVDFLKTIP